MRRTRTYPKRSAGFKLRLFTLFLAILLGSGLINSCNTNLQNNAQPLLQR